MEHSIVRFWMNQYEKTLTGENVPSIDVCSIWLLFSLLVAVFISCNLSTYRWCFKVSSLFLYWIRFESETNISIIEARKSIPNARCPFNDYLLAIVDFSFQLWWSLGKYFSISMHCWCGLHESIFFALTYSIEWNLTCTYLLGTGVN